MTTLWPIGVRLLIHVHSDTYGVFLGQNSYGAAHSDDTANWQKNISAYCDDDSIDVFPVSQARSTSRTTTHPHPLGFLPPDLLCTFCLLELPRRGSKKASVQGKGDLPVINLAGTCNDKDNSKFDGSDLLDCSFMADEIKKCQAKGKAVTISMGGATGANTFGSEDQAKGFADQVWDLFLGGDSKTRPFGDAVLYVNSLAATGMN